MAIPDTELTDTFDTFRQNVNSATAGINAQLDSTVLAGLTTTAKDTLVDAINEVVSSIEETALLYSIIMK